MDGTLKIDNGGIADLLDLCGLNSRQAQPQFVDGVLRVAGWLKQMNARGAARRNAAHHYDLSYDLYRSFLDPDLQYSCAYFADPCASLEEAQDAKKRHISAKLALRPGHKVLDIGCGWGGLALYLARTAGVEVHGITLSHEQLAIAQRRAAASGFGDRVSFGLEDYRDVKGPFDRIVSVGMFEHVGVPNYRSYFEALARLLTPSGVALVHAIGRAFGPSFTSSWIDKYIFPGGYAPALSEVTPWIEQAGLWLTDLEIWRMHYAETLKLWRQRFLAADGRLPVGCDDRFRRMWEFYLASSETGFRHCGLMAFKPNSPWTLERCL